MRSSHSVSGAVFTACDVECSFADLQFAFFASFVVRASCVLDVQLKYATRV